MKKSDIYEFAIKIMGLYLVVSVIEHLRDIVSYATVMIQLPDKPEQMGDFSQMPVFIVILLNFLTLTAFVWLLVFRTKKIVRLICSEEDYSETTSLSASKTSIIEIALILVGLMTAIWTVPEFAIKLNNYVSMTQNSITATMRDITFLFVGGLKLVVGVLAVRYAKSISSYVTKEKEEIGNDRVE